MDGQCLRPFGEGGLELAKSCSDVTKLGAFRVKTAGLPVAGVDEAMHFPPTLSRDNNLLPHFHVLRPD